MYKTSPATLTLPTLSLQSVRATEGLRWIQQGIKTFTHYPLGFTGIFSAMMLVCMLAFFIPVLGIVCMFFFVPWFSLGFMAAAYRALRAEIPTVSVFFEPMRGSRQQMRGMLKLGALFTGVTLVLLWGSFLIGAPALAPLLEDLSSGQVSLEELAKQPAIQSHILLSMSLVSLVSLVFWHTPGLVFWGQQPVLRSVIFSIVALWKNKWAFVVYGFSWITLSSTAWLIVSSLMTALQIDHWLPFVSLILMSTINSMLLLSIFFSFVGCFLPAQWQAQADPR